MKYFQGKINILNGQLLNKNNLNEKKNSDTMNKFEGEFDKEYTQFYEKSSSFRNNKIKNAIN